MGSITDELIHQVRELHEKSQSVAALRLAESAAPLRQWRTSAAARVLAGRLAAFVGAPLLASAHHYRAYLEFPDDPDVIYYRARLMLERRGPLPAWEFVRAIGDLPANADDDVRSDWYAHHACIARLFRDFETAESWLDRAQQLAPARPWLWIERAALFESEDRYEDCLAASRNALELRPGYRPAVQSAAHALQLLDRDEEALALLIDAAAVAESGPVVAQLSLLQWELKRYDEAWDSLDRFETLSPLMERAVRKWVEARRSDIACARGEFDAALEHAKRADNPWHKQIIEHLSEPENRTANRVLHDVPFVRQHHLTCAPATLSAIGRYWSKTVEHLAVVEEICYDGTPAHSERGWADANGWTTREFTLTWDAAVALLDRGVPFTLTTVEPGNAHLQAIVGYDARRRTLLVRDPSIYYVGEMMFEPMLERYASTGPRGMVLVPNDRAQLLDGIDLPDAPLWDRAYDVHRALTAHDRQAAQRIADQMRLDAPEHRLTINVRRTLAAYDADTVASLSAAEDALKDFPADANLLLNKLSCLFTLGRREEYLAQLQPLCARHDSDPLFWQMYARELLPDARQHALARRLARRTIRRRGNDAVSYCVLADILWDAGDANRERAAELYRFAACVEDKQEGFARSHFSVSRHLRKTSDAIRFLTDRFERFGKRSAQPARTLVWALEELQLVGEAFDVLDKALALRPDDGELLLFAASCYARYGRNDDADRVLERARGKCSTVAHLRANAEMASLRGELESAREMWRRVCDAEPLDVDAHGRLAQLLAETESSDVALAHLQRLCDRFPHHYGLKRLHLVWLRNERSALDVEPAVRELIAMYPDDVWARRELSAVLIEQRRTDDAMIEAEAALRIHPDDTASLALLGRVQLAAGRVEEARTVLREAIRRSADNGLAINALVADACDTPELKREALRFFCSELKRQATFADGLLAYVQHALGVIDNDEQLAVLQGAYEARPDQWQTWTALTRQLITMRRLDEAAELTARATERFPLLSRIWIDRAEVCRARHDIDGERAALERAVQIDPAGGFAARELAGLHQRQMDSERALQLLEQTIARAPLDAYNYGCLADVLWQLNRRDEAVAKAQRAVAILPGYEWGWRVLRGWAAELRRPQLVEQAARELTTRRPGEARSWLVLAQNLVAPEQYDERLSAIDKAIALAPRLVEAHDWRAKLLADKGNFDAALAACAPAVFGSNETAPIELRARAAAILWMAGRRPLAFEKMQAVVRDAPQFQGAWSTLADWYRSVGDNVCYLATARQMTELFPHDPTAAGFLGDAELRNGNRSLAKEALARAIHIAPDYEYGAFELYELHVEDNELDAAQKVIDAIRPYGQPAHVTAREIALASRRGDAEAASRLLAKLCKLPFDERGILEHAIVVMEKGLIHDAIDVVFTDVVKLPNVNPLIGAAWVGRHTRLKLFGRAREQLKWLAQQNAPEPVMAAALARFLEDAADGNERAMALAALKKYQAIIRGHDRSWSAAGYALLILNLPTRMVQLMSDWRERPNAGQWTLSNLGIGLRRISRDTEAAEVTRVAMGLPPDQSHHQLALWSAADLAAAGDAPAAQTLLRALHPDAMPEYWRFVFHATHAHALSIALDGDRYERKRQLETIRRSLKAAEQVWPQFRKSPETKRLHRRTLSAVRRRCGMRTPGWVWRRMLGGSNAVPTTLSVGGRSNRTTWVVLGIVLWLLVHAARWLSQQK